MIATRKDLDDLAASLDALGTAIRLLSHQQQQMNERLRGVEFDNAIIGTTYALEERDRGVEVH